MLVIGAGNSGAEISLVVAPGHRTWLSGPNVGHLPFPIESWLGRHLVGPSVLRGLFHRVPTTGTPIGRRLRPKLPSKGGPVVRTIRLCSSSGCSSSTG